MANTLKFKRGLVAGLPTAALGEPLFTTDTFDLYIGNGTGNTRFQKYIASGATTQILRGDGSLYTFPLAISSPSTGQVLKYNGTSWVNDSDAGITGSLTTNYLSKATGASTIGNSLVFDNGTSVAIGTASPDYRLTIQAANLATLGLIDSAEATDQKRWVFQYGTTVGAGTFRLRAINDANSNGQNAYIITRTGIAVDTHQWFTAGSERFRIHATTGNFGINTGATDSGQRLQVNGTGYFSDSVGIGSTPAANVSLLISKNLSTPGVSYGIHQNGSASVTFPLGIANTPVIAASATVSAYRSFYTANPSIGSGATIGELVGYYVESNFVGATANYGFQGAIPSGSGRWNLYMSGTALNYMNGALLLGSTTDNGYKLQVNGGMSLGHTSGVAISYPAGQALRSTGGIFVDYGIGGTGDLVFRSGASVLNRLILDVNGNAGLGVTPSAWFTSNSLRALQLTNGGFVGALLGGEFATLMSNNWFANAAGSNAYIANGVATQYQQISGEHRFFTAASGVANATFSFTEQMRITRLGNLNIGSTTDSGERLQVTGTAKITGATFIGGGLTVQQTSNTYGFTLAQSNALNAGWGMWADTSGNYNLSRYGGGTYNSPALIISLSNAATLSSSLSVAGNLTVDTNTLFVDATNNRVGIGTASPSYGLDVQTTSNTVGIRAASNTANDILYYATGTVTGSLNAFVTSINATGGVGGQLLNSNSASGSAFLDINVTSASTGDPYLSLTTSGATNWSIGIDNSDSDKLKIGPNSNPSVGSASMTMFTGGNIAIGTTTDSGYRLRVNGTGYFDDNVRFPNTKGLLFENSSASAVGSIKMATGVTNPLEITNGTNTITLVAIGTAISSNLLVGAANIGTSATNTLVLGTGTAPSSSPTDSVQIYSADVVAGNAAPHIRTENGAVIKLYQETTSVGNSIISLGGGNAVLDDTTFDGYTLRQIVKALRNQGILA